MKQRFLLVLLGVFVLFSVYSQPSTDETASATGITLTIWDDKSNADESATLDKVIAEWEELHPDIKIEHSAVDIDSYKMKIKTAIAAGEMPDLFYTYGGGFSAPFVDSGKVLAIDSFLSDDFKKSARPGTLDYCRYHGKLYALPITMWMGVLYINTDYLKQINEDLPRTYDDLVRISKKLREKGVGAIGVGASEQWTAMFYYDVLALMEAGPDLSVAALEKKASFGEKAFADAAKKLETLVKNKAFIDESLSLNYDEMVAKFIQGDIPMLYQGNWLAGSLEADDSPVKGKIAVVNFPTTGGTGKSTDFLGGAVDVYMVANSTKHPQEAVDFLKFLSKKYSYYGFEAGEGLPIYNYDNMPELDPVTKQIVDLSATATSFVPAWDTFLPGADADVHLNLVQQLFAETITAEQYVEKMKELDNN